uniref:ATP-dependent DNA helicase n=1 Tax=Zeugodacus cucurbitae TaxID=28588 RepID=A0A0A1X3K5_ZEUCU
MRADVIPEPISLIFTTMVSRQTNGTFGLEITPKLQMNETPVGKIAKNSAITKIFQIFKKSLEVLHRTLKDLRDNENIFGEAMILLAGDFRQTIPGSTVADELITFLKSSNLWRHIKNRQLTNNIRVFFQQYHTAIVEIVENGSDAVDTSMY